MYLEQTLRQVGELYEEQLENLDQAFVIYGRLFREDIEDPYSRELVERLASVMSAWLRLADLYEAILKDADVDTQATAALAFRLGEVAEERLHDFRGPARPTGGRTPSSRATSRREPGTRVRRHRGLGGAAQSAPGRRRAPTTRRRARRCCSAWRRSSRRSRRTAPRRSCLRRGARRGLGRRAGDRGPRPVRTTTRSAGTTWRDLLLRQIEQSADARLANALRYRLAMLYQEQLADVERGVDARGGPASRPNVPRGDRGDGSAAGAAMCSHLPISSR